MSDDTESPEWGSRPDDAPTLEQRRGLLELLLVDRSTLAELGAGMGSDFMPFVLQAVAGELMHTSIGFMEHVEVAEGIFALVGGLCPMTDLSWLEPADHPLEGDEFNNMMRKIGRHQAERIDSLEEMLKSMVGTVTKLIDTVQRLSERLADVEALPAATTRALRDLPPT